MYTLIFSFIKLHKLHRYTFICLQSKPTKWGSVYQCKPGCEISFENFKIDILNP